MHSFIRSIGFGKLTKKKLDQIYYETRQHPDYIFRSRDLEGNTYIEYQKEILPGIGLAFRGQVDEEEGFTLEYYFPYIKGSKTSTTTSVEIVRESDRESFFGICDDNRFGVELIFFLQDMMPYLSSYQREESTVSFGGVTLSGLATDAKILLPIKKTIYQKERIQRLNGKREQLITAAKNGDEEAMEELTITEMDLYAYISKRAEKEDVFSIVNTYFMPNGIESDKYSMLGEIKSYTRMNNPISKEDVYVMNVLCNDTSFDICVSERDVLGIPAPGRRIKCKIWLQGMINA